MRRRTPQVLVKKAKYQAKYVAFGPDGNKIIASGSDPSIVVRKARSKGVKVPAIVFVPKDGVTYIYYCTFQKNDVQFGSLTNGIVNKNGSSFRCVE